MVSGSFKNLAGLIASIDAANGTLTLKDLATKKTVTVTITANSNVRTLPPQAATMFAARAKGGAAGGGAAPAQARRPGGGIGSEDGRAGQDDLPAEIFRRW